MHVIFRNSFSNYKYKNMNNTLKLLYSTSKRAIATEIESITIKIQMEIRNKQSKEHLQ